MSRYSTTLPGLGINRIKYNNHFPVLGKFVDLTSNPSFNLSKTNNLFCLFYSRSWKIETDNRDANYYFREPEN